MNPCARLTLDGLSANTGAAGPATAACTAAVVAPALAAILLVVTIVDNQSNDLLDTCNIAQRKRERSDQKLDGFSQNIIIFAFNFTVYYLL